MLDQWIGQQYIRLGFWGFWFDDFRDFDFKWILFEDFGDFRDFDCECNRKSGISNINFFATAYFSRHK